MSLIDLRAYFQRDRVRKPCNEERREPGQHPAELGWLCTLPKDHAGSHVAHDIDGTIITRWLA